MHFLITQKFSSKMLSSSSNQTITHILGLLLTLFSELFILLTKQDDVLTWEASTLPVFIISFTTPSLYFYCISFWLEFHKSIMIKLNNGNGPTCQEGGTAGCLPTSCQGIINSH